MSFSVESTHNVEIKFTPAGVIDRIAATLIDFAIFIAIFMSFAFLSAFAENADFMYFMMIVASFIITFYHLICEIVFNGKSLGKMALNIQVVRLDGSKLTFWNCLLRWIFRLIDITITSGSIAIITIIFSKKSQRLGDMAAGTTVIKHKKGVTLSSITIYDTNEEYEVMFDQAYLLSDEDVKTMQLVLREVYRTGNYALLKPLTEKVKEKTGIQTEMNNLDFIQKLIKDYIHLSKNS